MRFNIPPQFTFDYEVRPGEPILWAVLYWNNYEIYRWPANERTKRLIDFENWYHLDHPYYAYEENNLLELINDEVVEKLSSLFTKAFGSNSIE